MKRNTSSAARSKIAIISFQVLDLFLSQTALTELCKNLTGRGNRVDFFGIRSRRARGFSETDFHLIAIPMRAFPIVTHICYLALFILILPFYIAVRRPDFVILTPKFGVSVLALESRLFPSQLRPRIVLDIRSTPVALGTFRKSLEMLAFAVSIITAAKMFDGITLATNRMKEEVCSKFRLSCKLARVWHNGVDLDLFRPQEKEGYRMRKKLGLSDKFVVFYHGAFRLNGGITETIKNIQILKKNHPDIMLFLLGAGPGLKLFENLIRESKIEDNVVIHKPVDYSDVPKYIAMADVGIVPLPDISDWRNQSPLKLIEYLAMGKTVIATDIPANRELIGEEKCGIYISAANPEAIAEAIVYAYNNRERLEEWGASGRAIVKKEYDWKTVAQDFEKHLHEISES